MSTCPMCAEDVDGEATTCPHCKRPLPVEATPKAPPPASIDARLSALERDVRRWRLRTIILGMVLAAAAGMAFVVALWARGANLNQTEIQLTDGVHELRLDASGLEVRAGGSKRLELGVGDDGNVFITVLDKAGVMRGALSVIENAPGFVLTDGAGNIRLGASVEAVGPSFWLWDSNRKRRVGLQVAQADGDEQPQILVADKNERRRAAIAFVKDTPRLELNNEQGESRAALSVIGERPLVVLHGRNGKARTTLGVDDRGGSLRLLDEQERERAVVADVGEGTGMTLFSPQGEVRAGMWMPIEGAPFVGVMQGKAAAVLKPATSVAEALTVDAVTAPAGGGGD